MNSQVTVPSWQRSSLSLWMFFVSVEKKHEWEALWTSINWSQMPENESTVCIICVSKCPSTRDAPAASVSRRHSSSYIIETDHVEYLSRLCWCVCVVFAQLGKSHALQRSASWVFLRGQEVRWHTRMCACQYWVFTDRCCHSFYNMFKHGSQTLSRDSERCLRGSFWFAIGQMFLCRTRSWERRTAVWF